MTLRMKKYIVAGCIIAAMVLGHILERYGGWHNAFMTIAGIAVALAAAWLIGVILEQRRQERRRQK
ncbi:MAG: hypothetical protein H8E30_05515 [Alphaproteobacteria bacterium]|nr:hypothetical protein [Alphaproteobacteria bacterium]